MSVQEELHIRIFMLLSLYPSIRLSQVQAKEVSKCTAVQLLMDHVHAQGHSL